MRKVTVGMSVSLDGFVATNDGNLDWVFANVDDELNLSTIEVLSALDTVLMGRVTYEGQAATWPNAEGPFADIMNGLNKVVFSSTLEEVEWANSRLATATPAEEIAQLKGQPGKGIGVAGGAKFVQSLSRDRLVDEYRLAIHPLVLGDGLSLFADPINLTLDDSRTFANGVVLNTYQPA